MVALDTNVLVRYVIQDDKQQSQQVNHVIETLTPDAQGFISCVVLCELIWVLESAYQVNKTDCIAVLKRLCSIPVFDIERLHVVLRAVKYYEHGKADFSDYLIREIAEEEGYDTVLTFDKKALASDGFHQP